jgi:superfamily II DNA or RNA helicase
MNQSSELDHTIPLRRWQRRALKRIAKLRKRDALIVATPGSGKTLLALMLAQRMFKEGQVERLVIVTVTDHLRIQWKDAAHKLGINLDPRWSNADGVEAPDYHGVAVSYHQVSFAPSLFRMNCKRRTLVIFDEIHHAADDLKWGDALREAFETADFRLALSGTPFRSDNNPIPFVTYEEGRSKADFTYSYGESLADDVCRPVYFHSYEGDIEWQSRDQQYEMHSLLEQLTREKAAERFRTALQPEGGWMVGVLSEADRQLTALRSQGHHDAAGLVFAIDQEHARRISKVLMTVTGGAEVALVISDEPESAANLMSFASGSGKWLVCVRMVSEGVEIPRLRVGVYATNVTAELTFRQAVGRFVRVIGIDDEYAIVFIPAMEALVRNAIGIKEEREHQLTIGGDMMNGRALTTGDGMAEPSAFVPIASQPRRYETFFDGGRFNRVELAHAYEVGREMGLRLPPEIVAALLRRGAAKDGVFVLHSGPDLVSDALAAEAGERAAGPEIQRVVDTTLVSLSQEIAEQPLWDRKQLLRNEVSRLTNRLAGLLGFKPWQVHRQWKDAGGMPQGKATVEDLVRKREWLLQRTHESVESRSTAG